MKNDKKVLLVILVGTGDVSSQHVRGQAGTDEIRSRVSRDDRYRNNWEGIFGAKSTANKASN